MLLNNGNGGMCRVILPHFFTSTLSEFRMDNEIDYKSNPLHGVSLKTMLTELVDHYGFEILYAYLYINCFKTNPSIASSVKFLNKTDWARENVEGFYPEATIVFVVRDAAAHYHVPLLLSAHGYSTYRGS